MNSRNYLNISLFIIVAGAGIIFSALMIPETANAQQNGPLDYSGSVGFTVRGYGVSGIPARQEALSAQAFANTSFNLLGLRSGINFTYTTQESRINQNLNRLSFNTNWSWGAFSAGDVNPGYSRYGLRGINVRGGELSLNRGEFSLSLAGGQNRRPNTFNPEQSFSEPAFRRLVYAAKLGYGRETSSYIRFSGAYIRDQQSSIGNPESISPAENVHITTEGGLELFAGRLHLHGEVTASALTLDMRNPAITTGGSSLFPSFLMSEREGSFIDFAGEMQMRLTLDSFRLQAQYERIQPGYESLGLSRILNDVESFRLQPTFILMNNRLRVNIQSGLTRNNLLGQLFSTYYRYQLGSNLQYTVSDRLTLSGGFTYMGNENRPSAEVEDPVRLEQKQISQMIMFSPTFSFESGEQSHMLSYSGNLQFMSDQSRAVREGIRPDRDQTVSTNTLSYRVQFPSGFSLNSSGNFLISEGAGTSIRSAGANLGTGFRFFDDRLNTNITAGWSQNRLQINSGQTVPDRITDQLNTTLSANYRFGDASTLRFQLRGLSNNNRAEGVSNYQELQGSLQFNYRF